MTDSTRIVRLETGALREAFADAFAGAAREALSARGVFQVALTGGSTCRDFYPALAQLRLPWESIVIWFGDERMVPALHPDSNYGQAKRALLDNIADPKPTVRRIPGEVGGREAARVYAALLDEAGPLDLVHLGVGPDGHICSLFEGMPEEQGTRARWVTDSPKPPAERVSLTEVALREARCLHFVATGQPKADAVRELLSGQSAQPAARARLYAKDYRIFVDPAAAAQVDCFADPF